MTHSKDRLVQEFFDAVARGELPLDLTTEDMAAWTLTSGDTSRERFAGGVKLLAAIFGGTLRYKITSTTAENDRVVAEARSSGTLINGEAFSNLHVFIFSVRGGRIAGVKEYMNPIVVAEKLAPLMHEAMAAANSPDGEGS